MLQNGRVGDTWTFGVVLKCQLKVLTILKGGGRIKKVHSLKWWSQNVLPCLDGGGGGGNKFQTCDFPIL